ncbi:MAG TPA: ABC transporter ATP-binding protein [Acidimicrobiia bacterium]|jgi:branched-chain amino acid transport system ATP-binding protein
MLEFLDVSVRFGGLRALDGLSFSVREGEVLGMIGPNGSGKSTAFNVISGTLAPDRGTVRFYDEDITALAPNRIAHKGIARTFQVVRPFPHLSALDNVLAGRLFGGRGNKKSDATVAEAEAVLAMVGLAAKAHMKASSFTILERKWLEVARALAGRPKLILLDEFMAGISASEIPDAVAFVSSINVSGVTVVLVEHIVKAITGACHRVIVLDAGRKLAEGSVDEVFNDPTVIEAYLGSRHAGR